MARPDNIKDLHDVLVRDGYDDVGTEEQFRTFLANKNNAAALYNVMQRDGYDDIGTYEQFSNFLYGDEAKSEPQRTFTGVLGARAAQAAPSLTASASAKAASSTPSTPRSDDGTGKGLSNALMARATAQQTEPAADDTEDKPLGPEKFAKHMELEQRVRSSIPSPETMMQDFNQRMENMRKGNNPFGHNSEQWYNPETGKIETVYFTTGGDEVSTSMEQSQLNQEYNNMYNTNKRTREDIASLSERIDRRLNEIQDAAAADWRKKEEQRGFWGNLGHAMMSAEDPSKMGSDLPHMYDNYPEIREYGAAQRKMRNAKRIIAEADHNAEKGTFGNWLEQSFAGGAARGFAQKATDIDTWDFGLTDLSDNVALLNALNAADRGEQLTEAQQALLDATVIEMAVNTYFGSEVGRGYKAGSVTAESLPFMLEMMINPAASIGESIGAKMTRYAIKRFGKAAVKKGGKRYAARKGMEMAGRVLGDALLGAPLMTATTGSVRTNANAFERMNDAALRAEKMSYGEAFGKAFAETTIENFSEMFGAYFAPLAGATGEGLARIATSKAGSKIGLNHVYDFMENVGASDLARIVSDFERHAKWHGTISEYTEEVVGGVMNALVVGDQTLDADPETGLFNRDQIIDTFLGVALMGGILSGIKTVGYRTPKYQARKAMNDAEKNCRSVFDNKNVNLDDILATLSNGNVAEVKAALIDIVTNPDYTEEQKLAVLDYASKATAYKGILTSEQKRKASGEESAEQTASEEAFDTGYEATDAETRHDIAMELADESLGTMTEEERKAAWDGVLQRIEDEADEYENTMRRDWRKRQHHDGFVRPVVLKEKDENGNDKRAFLVDNNVVMTADGTMVDPTASDNFVFIYDPATDETRMIDPASDMGILSMGEPVSEEDYRNTLQQLRDEFVQSKLDEAQGTVRVELGQQLTMPDGKQGVVIAMSPDGESFTVAAEDGSGEVSMERSDLQKVADAAAIADYEARHKETEAPAEEAPVDESRVAGAPREYNEDMEMRVRDDDGEEHDVRVLGRMSSKYENGKQTLIPDPKGNIIEYYDVNTREVFHDHDKDLEGKVLSYKAEEATPAAPVVPEPKAEPEAETEPVAAPAVEPEREQAEEAPQAPTAEAEAPTGTAAEPTVEPMPMLEDGEADFMATTPERGHQYIYDEAGLSREEANQFVNANLDAATKTLNSEKKKTPKMGTSLVKYKQQQAEYQAKVDAAQQAVDYWHGVKAVQSAIVAAENAEKAERDRVAHEAAVQAETARQAEELVKREAEAELGSNNVAPQIVEKWQSAKKVEGVENEITLANGEKVKGHYMLVESGAATPSHNPNMEFTRNEGFPIDENGQTVNDRDYERDQEAQRITRQMADNYDSRAIQSVPVVSPDGIVLSGNGRTMAGELAAQHGTDGAYIEHLKKYPQQFGFTVEQVEGMQHPRVVFVADEAMPYTTETFAKFNQQDMKSQSRTEQSVKMGKTVDDNTFGRIIRSINGFDSLADFYNDPVASVNAIGELHKAGAINDMQLAEMMDGEKVSGIGRQMLENMLIGKAFESNPDAIRQLAEFPAMRQSVVSALAEIANNIHLGEEYSLDSEFAQAINLAYQARKNGVKAGEKVSWFARQQSLFPFDTGETVADYTNATVLMLADELNSASVNGLKKCLALYNRNAAEAAAGQYDIFSGGIKNKQDIINDALNVLNYGTEQEQQAALAAAVEQRKQGVQQDGLAGTGEAGDAGATAGQSDLAQTEVSALLSDELDEFGKPFVLASDGTTTFGEVSVESGLTAAPIKLSVGENRVDEDGNHGYGILHIEAGHGQQIRDAGFSSVEEFVETVAKNYDTIREGGVVANNQTYLLEISDEHNNTLFIQLSRDGKYWNVNSAGIFKKKYSRHKPEVYTRPAVETETDTDFSEVNRGLSEGATATSGNSSLTSGGKDTNISETDKEKVASAIESAESEVNTNPTEGQKEAGNYKKGHLKLDGYDITIEQPKGSIRRGTDDNGKQWEPSMLKTSGVPITARIGDIKKNGMVVSTDGKVEIMYSSWSGSYVLIVPKTKKDGAKYYENDKILSAINGTFYQRGNKFAADIRESDLRKVVNELANLGVRVRDEQADNDLLSRGVIDEERIAELESQPKMKMYRSMVLIDGKLYPPMSSKEADGKGLREPSEIGKWEESEEAPDKAVLKNGKWVFPLKKDNGKSLYAAYNPYIHTSATMLNDQFSEAQSRDNLVVVEMEVPISELTSGYHAEKAKDNVGMKQWKAGVIQGQLSGTREVMLSRWAKPVRIVPTEEVAENIAKQIDGVIPVMPSNVVTPQVREVMEKLGVKFVETDNTGKIKTGENKGRSWTSVYGKGKSVKSLMREGGAEAIELERPSEVAGWQEYTMPERWFDIQRGTMAYEDGVRMSKLRGYSKKRYDAMLERVVDGFKKHVVDTAERMHIGDRVQVVATADEITDVKLTEKQKKDKGLYSPKTGKIYIILGNHRDMDDVMKSLLHEAVAHHGLRELFGEHFDTFLDNVYEGSEEPIRQKIASMAAAHGWNMHTATEEYLAQMAETIDFEKPENNSWWGKVKMWFYDMLNKIGFKVRNWFGTITDNELAYVLWRSYQNLVNPGRYRSPIEVAEDTVMQENLKVGRYEEPVGRYNLSQNRETIAAEGVAKAIVNDIKLDNDAYIGMWMRLEGADMSVEQAKAVREEIEHEIRSGLTQEELANHYDMLDAVNEYIAEREVSDGGNGILSRDDDDLDEDEQNREKRKKAETETEDIWKNPAMSLKERITASVLRIAERNGADKRMQQDAMRAVGENLADLQKEMARKRRIEGETLRKAKRAVGDMEGELEEAVEMQMVVEEARKKGYISGDEYRMSHTAPNGRDGFSKSIADPTDIYPEDLYGPNGALYYGDGERWMDTQSANVFKRVHHNPEAMVKVYRAVPKSLKETKLRNGDWVSVNREYAKEHGERNINGGYKIIEDEVPAKYVFTDGNSLHEQGYDDGKEYAYQNTKNNRKLLDAVTYDDEGNVIPLSKRFNKRNADIRYQKGVKTDKSGNPINNDGSYLVESLHSAEEINDSDFENPTRNIVLPELSDETANAIGAVGRTVLIKKSIFEKSKREHKELTPEECRRAIQAALTETTHLINDKPVTKPNYWVLVRVGDKNALVTIDTDPQKKYVEVVGWRSVRNESLEQIKNRALREGGQVLITQKGAAGLSALTESSVSDAKVQTNFEPTKNNLQNTENEGIINEKLAAKIDKKLRDADEMKAKFSEPLTMRNYKSWVVSQYCGSNVTGMYGVLDGVPREIPYREAKSTPTLGDYFIDTKAEFEAIGTILDKNYNGYDALNADAENLKLWNEMKESGKYEWHQSPMSYSEYLIDREEGDVYRFSDHWGTVASCSWNLGFNIKGPRQIGKCNIKDFQPIVKFGRNSTPNKEFYAAAIRAYNVVIRNLNTFLENVEMTDAVRKDVKKMIGEYEWQIERANDILSRVSAFEEKVKNGTLYREGEGPVEENASPLGREAERC